MTTPKQADLKALRDRVAALTKPDREVDGDIYSGLGLLRQYEEVYPRNGDYCLRYYPGPPGPDYLPLPRLTASIDAALALVERLLPGWHVRFTTWGGATLVGEDEVHKSYWTKWFDASVWSADGDTVLAAPSIILAALDALIAKQEVET